MSIHKCWVFFTCEVYLAIQILNLRGKTQFKKVQARKEKNQKIRTSNFSLWYWQ